MYGWNRLWNSKNDLYRRKSERNATTVMCIIKEFNKYTYTQCDGMCGAAEECGMYWLYSWSLFYNMLTHTGYNTIIL